MRNEPKTKTISIKVTEKAYKQFCDTVKERGISKSQNFSNMVYSSCYIDKQRIAMETVNLMECISALDGKCDPKLYTNLRRAGERVCQSLLIR